MSGPGSDPKQIWEVLMALGDRTEEPTQAVTHFKRAAEYAERFFGPLSATTGLSLMRLARCYEQAGEHEKAQPLYDRVRAILVSYAQDILPQ